MVHSDGDACRKQPKRCSMKCPFEWSGLPCLWTIYRAYKYCVNVRYKAGSAVAANRRGNHKHAATVEMGMLQHGMTRNFTLSCRSDAFARIANNDNRKRGPDSARDDVSFFGAHPLPSYRIGRLMHRGKTDIVPGIFPTIVL
eukprot:scaffold4511_cov171-Amphora_coffeaeformis.AAC.19